MKTKVIELKDPVTVNGETFTAFTVRSPKVKDVMAMEKFSKDEIDRGVYMMALLCDTSMTVIGEMETPDFMEIQRFIAPFLA